MRNGIRGVLVAAFMAPVAVWAGGGATDDGAGASVCRVDASKFESLCADVGMRIPDKDKSGPYEYRYQRQVYEAACVDLETDSEAEIARKVSTVWNANEDWLYCSSNQFNVPNGSILKYAVSRTFTAFLDDAIEIWQVNLNKVDASDGRTLLDYVASEQEKRKGTGIEKTLQQYYDKLRRYGAKHRAELNR